jgi:ubiquinol-cytochrome c reductase cytochrome b subunit
MADPKLAAAPASGRLARLGAWIDERFPMTSLWKEHVSEYYAPKNFNFWYYFGSIALFVLALQIVTGSS